MKSNFVINLIKAAYLLMFTLLPTVMFAQTPPFPPGPGSTGPVTPIDDGLIFLFILGISFGVYQLIQLRKKQLI